ncbi:MAG: YdcF family protein [Romboutsia sp.]
MISYLDLIVGLIFSIYYFYLEIVYNGMAFDKFFIIIGIVLIIYHFIKNKIHLEKKYIKIFNFIMVIAISVFLLVESILIFFPKTNIKDECDYLVILGASVKNTTPSLTLRGRLDKAIEYIRKSKDDCYIVVSGGQGSDENISEAEAMEKYLVEHKVPKNKIIIENKSTSTYENLKYSKKKIEQHSNKSVKDLRVKVVTTDFHSFRSYILAKKNGYSSINFYSNKSINQFIPVYYAREFFATFKTLIFDLALNI